MASKCTCISKIYEKLPIREIAELVAAYVPHHTDVDIIRARLAFGMREWVVKANDEFVPAKNRDRKTTFNISRQDVIFKICLSNQVIMFDLEETCNRYHSHTMFGILTNKTEYDPALILMKPWERNTTLLSSSALFLTMVEKVRFVMNERILAILAKADRHV